VDPKNTGHFALGELCLAQLCLVRPPRWYHSICAAVPAFCEAAPKSDAVTAAVEEGRARSCTLSWSPAMAAHSDALLMATRRHSSGVFSPLSTHRVQCGTRNCSSVTCGTRTHTAHTHIHARTHASARGVCRAGVGRDQSFDGVLEVKVGVQVGVRVRLRLGCKVGWGARTGPVLQAAVCGYMQACQTQKNTFQLGTATVRIRIVVPRPL